MQRRPLSNTPKPDLPKHFKATVRFCYDGDGFLCKKADRYFKCRLIGADAPEMKQAFGPDAKLLLSQLTRGVVTLTTFGRDKYGRALVAVQNNHGMDVAFELLHAGLAWPTTIAPPGKKILYSETVHAVKAARKGLWREDNPEPPWQWRKRKRESA